MREHNYNVKSRERFRGLRYFDSTTVNDDDLIVASEVDEHIDVPITMADLERSFGNERRLQRRAKFMAHAAAIRFARGERFDIPSREANRDNDYPAVLLSGDAPAIPANQAFLRSDDGAGTHFPAKEGVLA